MATTTRKRLVVNSLQCSCKTNKLSTMNLYCLRLFIAFLLSAIYQGRKYSQAWKCAPSFPSLCGLSFPHFDMNRPLMSLHVFFEIIFAPISIGRWILPSPVAMKPDIVDCCFCLFLARQLLLEKKGSKLRTLRLHTWLKWPVSKYLLNLIESCLLYGFDRL